MSWEDQEQSKLAGRVAGMLHTASDSFSSRYQRLPLDLEHLIDAPIAAIHPFLEDRSEDWSFLRTFAAKLRSSLLATTNKTKDLDWGVCHGDLSAGNMLIAADGRVTVLDFDFCGPGWRAFDLAHVRSRLTPSGSSPRKKVPDSKWHAWDSFLKGYIDVKPLKDIDRDSFAIFHIINHLFFLGLHASNARYWGTKRINDEYHFSGELAFFRKCDANNLQPNIALVLRDSQNKRTLQ